MSEPIVVTGLGFVTPLGTGIEEVWSAFTEHRSGVRLLGEDDPRTARGVDPNPLPPSGRAGLVRGFQPRDHVKSPHLRRMDWFSRMVVAATAQAFSDTATSDLDDEARSRCAIVIGSRFGNQRETSRYLERVIRAGPCAGQPLLFPNLVLNAAAGYAAIELGLRGPNLTVSEHEASGEAAVANAMDLLRGGLADLVVVGGADEFGEVYLDALRERRLLDPESVPPGSPRRSTRGTMVPGEGAAALVLETASHARARGRAPYAAVACARSGALPAAPYGFPEPTAAAERLLALTGNGSGAPLQVAGLIGGASGAAPRDAIDGALLEALRARQAEPVTYVRLDRLVGEWGGRGALAVALASLAIARGNLPALDPGSPEAAAAIAPGRILVPGAARGGVLVPVVVESAAN